MHPLRSSLLLASFLTAEILVVGCTSVPSPFDEQIKAASRQYEVVHSGQSIATIEAKLGPATRQEADGSSVWETRYDPLNFASVRAWFDASGKVTRLEHSRGHGVSTPMSRSSVVITRDR